MLVDSKTLLDRLEIEMLVYTAVTTICVLILPIIVLMPAIAWILYSGLYLKK